MRKSVFTRATALCLAVMMLCGAFGIAASASAVGTTDNMTSEELRQLLNADSYLVYDAELDEKGIGKGSGEAVLGVYDVYSYSEGGVTYYYDAERGVFYKMVDGVRVDMNEGDLDVGFDTYGGREAILSPASGTLTWKVNIPTTGRYAMEIVYYPVGVGTSAIERMVYVDGKVQFAEARYVSLSKTWKYLYQDDGGFKQDLNGNELKPNAVMSPEWTKTSFADANGFYRGPLEFYFDNKGEENVEHTIALSATREAMAISSLRVYACEDAPSYASVLAGYKQNGYQAAQTGLSTMIEAERPDAVSDTSVYASNDRTSAVTSPSNPGVQLMNVIGANSYNTVGQWARYSFTVPKSGLYSITIRAKQDQLAGMYTSRALRLMGGHYGDSLNVPFAEAYNCRFNYVNGWQFVTLGDGTQTFQFYFEEGVTYTMSLDVSLGTLAETVSSVEQSLKIINASYLEILKLTGADPDEYRDYNFFRIMPDTLINLRNEYERLTRVSEELTALCGSKGSHVATLDKVAYLLELMSYNEDKIAANLENLKSYIGSLGTWLNTSKQQSLVMDYIVVGGMDTTTYETTYTPKLDAKYRENANFFEAIGYEIMAFIQSFLVDYNQMGVTERTDANTSVEVWMATGRDQASIWRNQVDSSFTSTEAGKGIAVDLKLIVGGTLLPSVLAGKGPDLYMGLGSGDVINYAIRSAVLPITQYVQADPDALSCYNAASLVPISMYDQLYGMPETVDFSMMFYRKDVLANLGLDVPQTWDDILSCVPVFQSSNMEIGLSRDFDMFLYQNGGDRWYYGGTNYTGTRYTELMCDRTFATYFDYMEVAYDSDASLEAFQNMCRFFTDYSFPVSFDASNRFRTGEMPIIIGGAVGTYNTLTVFATEIRGLWMFSNVPGTRHSDGTIHNEAMASVSATVMMNGVKDGAASWRFMKWLTSADVQAEYGNGMVSILGPSAKYATANMKAVEKLSWTTEERNNLLKQFNNLATIPNYPGAYIIDRYINFAFLNAYGGKDAAEELQGYVKTINKEITRKRQEFELPVLEDGQTVDDAITDYIAYLKTLSDSELAGFSEYVRNYIRTQA